MIGPSASCPEGIALALFDLDDTIVMDGIKVSPRVLDAIDAARERGAKAAVATGRGRQMVPEVLRSPQHMDYLICANGAGVYDTSGRTISESLMSGEGVLSLIDTLRPLGATWYAFTEDGNYFEWKSLSYLVTGYRERLGSRRGAHGTGGTGVASLPMLQIMRHGLGYLKRMVMPREGTHQVRSVRPFVRRAGQLAKVGCSLPSSAACERAVATIEHMGSFSVARMSPFELEITAKGATKGAAASLLMDHLHVGPARAVCFGDSQNDVPLARACGTFVAMGNADDEVKELADEVCETVYDDGVARWLERVIREGDDVRHG
jgi:hydroxymethylpyrimidine pyrophosphatase-like HAD family hydrolase